MSKHPLAKVTTDLVERLEGKPNTFGSPASIDKDGANTTCSTFLTLMLAKYEVSRMLWAALFGKTWPRARDYFNTFDRLLLGGDSARALADIKPGTLGAIGYSEDRDGNSGHCFIALWEPYSLDEQRGKLRKYALKVVDSSRTGHGIGDTRYSKGQHSGGIGIGKMALWVDEEGIVQCYSWSLESTSDVLYNGNGQSIAFANIPSDWSLRNG